MLVNVFALAPLGIGLLLWFCLPPDQKVTARKPLRHPEANPAYDHRQK